MDNTSEPGNLLAVALSYAARGYPVLPLYPLRDGQCACPESYKTARRCKPGKHPIGDLAPQAHENATTDPSIVTTWWSLWPDANIGLALGAAGLIDVAPDSPLWWGNFKAQGLPTTAHFASGGGDGHEHWLYHRGDIPSVRIARRGEYDVLSDGYCVAPPSVHESGRQYEWIDQVAPVEAPEWVGQFVADRLAEREATSGETVVATETTVPPVGLTSAQHAVWENQAAVGQRSDALVDIARMLGEAGYQDIEGIASILAERDETLGLHKYLRRRDASLRYREIAARYGKPPLEAKLSGGGSAVPHLGREPGNHLGAPGQPPTGVEIFDPLIVRNHPETRQLRAPKLDWLVEPIIARGVITENVAKVKLGKTTFAMGLVRAGLAGDAEYCGLQVHRPFRTLYFTEEGYETFLVEMEDYGLNDLVEAEAFFTAFDFETARATPDNKAVTFSMTVDSLIRHVEQDRIDLVVLDTLSIIAGIEEEDHSGRAGFVMQEIRRISKSGAAVYDLRHGRKSGGELSDAGRGSSALSGGVDIQSMIQPLPGSDEETSNLRRLTLKGRGVPVMRPIVLEYDPETKRYRAVGEVLSKAERLAAAITATLVTAKAFDYERALSTNGITLATKGNRAGIQREVKEMGERGDLHHATRGAAEVYWTDEPLTAHLTGVVPVVPTVLEPVVPLETQPPTGVEPEASAEPTGTAKTPPEERRGTAGTTRSEPTPATVAKKAADKAARELTRLDAADVAAPTLSYLAVLTDADLTAAIAKLNPAAVSLDTETTGLDAHRDKLRTVNLSDGATHVVIDAWGITDWSPLQTYLDMVEQVRMHTYLFDLAFLQTVGVSIDPQKIIDVRTMSVVLEAQEEHVDYRLQGIAKRHLDEHVSKVEQRTGWDAPVLRHAKLAYAAEDARVTFAAADALHAKLLADPDLDGLFYCLSLEQDVQAATWWLASAGAPCDTQILEQAIADQEALIAARLTTLDTIAAVDSVNWKSPSQVLPILQARDLAITSTSVNALMDAQSDDAIIDALLKYRSAGTCLGLLWRTLSAVADDGRIYAAYSPIGAQTGRTSCSEPNLQQLPHETAARRAIRPGPGRVFVRADYAQLQIVIAAWLSKDANMQRILNQPGGDIHTATAQAVGCSRQQAKAINFGFLFGAGSETFRREQRKNGIILTEDQAKTYRNTFMRTYPGIRQWHRSLGEWNTEAEVIDDTGSGRRRSRIFSNNVKANTPVQMAEAHGFKLALQALYEDRGAVPSARLVMMVHDELIAECDYDERYQVAQWLKAHMVAAMQPLVDGVQVSVDATIVASYDDDDKKQGEVV